MPSNPHGLLLPPELSPRGRGHARRGGVPARFFKGVAGTLSILILLSSGLGYAVSRHFLGNILRIPFLTEGQHKAKKIGKAQNFLLIGADSRTSNPADCVHFGCSFGGSARSDTMILIHLAPNKDKVLLVSFPRDSWVDIPGHGFNKLNSAFEAGGPTLAAQTIEQLTNIHIDHLIQVDFTGFRRMVNALGGIDVCLPKAAKDKESGLNLPAGKSHILGDMALSFVRARKFDPTGDIGRIKRQQQFLGAMMRKARSSVFSSKIFSFLDTATKSLAIDKASSPSSLRNLALRLRNLDPGRVTFVTIPITAANGRRNGKSVVLLDAVKDRTLFDSINADSAIPGAKPAPTGPAVRLIVAPSRIRVRVLNGTARKGFARQAADDLSGVGFRILETTNADASTYTKTIVRYGPERADSAQTLAAAIPGAELQLDQSLGRSLELVVGTNYTGAHAVTISPVTASPAPGHATPPPSTTAADDACAGF